MGNTNMQPWKSFHLAEGNNLSGSDVFECYFKYWEEELTLAGPILQLVIKKVTTPKEATITVKTSLNINFVKILRLCMEPINDIVSSDQICDRI